MHLLLISNGQQTGMGYLEHARSNIAAVLPAEVRRVLFIPYASVTRSYDQCVQDLMPLMSALGRDVVGIHTARDKRAAIREAEAVFVRGGNTWQLVQMLRAEELLGEIREAVLGGLPYVGWSAGSNIACPTLQTTNDMPIVDPGGFATLGLVPFQINPHYLDGNAIDHGGESRETRIVEYLELHRDTYVVGLREGLMFRIESGSIALEGRSDRSARIFHYGLAPRELGVGSDLGFLMRP